MLNGTPIMNDSFERLRELKVTLEDAINPLKTKLMSMAFKNPVHKQKRNTNLLNYKIS